MYQWASIILIPKCPRSLNLPDLRNRLILPDPAVELRQDWERPIAFVMAGPRLALGRRS